VGGGGERGKVNGGEKKDGAWGGERGEVGLGDWGGIVVG